MLKTGTGLLFVVSVLASCGVVFDYDSPADISDQFYALRISEGQDLPEEFYLSESVRREVESLVTHRESMLGEYRSHKKVGSNRRVALDGQGKKETVIFIFEVTYEEGRAAETLTISRSKATEPYCITSYEIENLPGFEDPSPVGTSST